MRESCSDMCLASARLGARSAHDGQVIVARHMRKAAKVGAVGERGATGRDALVATRRDREGLSRLERQTRSSPQLDADRVLRLRMLLDLDRLTLCGTRGECQQSMREPAV